ncbi:unnamed protein product [Absidia cylindrospora]
MADKGKQPQTRSMQTRSSVVPTNTDDKPVSQSTSPSSPTLHTNILSPEKLDNASQAMTHPDPESSSTTTIKERHDSNPEEGVPEVTTSKSRVSPPTSIADSSTSSITSASSKDIARGSMVNNGVVSWILENYEVRPNSNVPRSGIYEHYRYYCTLQHVRPVNAATFGKLIRVAFPHMSTRRLGNRGQSKYQYCNIRRREFPEGATATLDDINVTTTNASKAADSSSMPSYSSIQQHQEQHYQAPIIDSESSTSLSNANVDSVQSTLFPYPVTESSQVTSGTQSGAYALPALQLPSPFGLIPSLSSSSSPPLLPQQHHLSNLELVSIFSSPPSTAQQQDTSTSAPSRPLTTSSSSTLLAEPETNVTRRLSDPRDTSNPTAQFATLYNQHCQDIYNTIFAGEFEKLQNIYDQFYGKMPSYYKSLMTTTPELTNYIWRWDCNLYDSLITDLLPKVNTHLTKTMVLGLNKYTRNLPGFLQYLLRDYPTQLRNKKSDVARVFVAKMRRHLTLTQFAMNAGDVLSQPIRVEEMKRDWQSLDMGTILDHVLWICECRNDDMRKILEGDIIQLLNTKLNLDKWMDWVDRLVEKFVPRFPRIHNSQEDEKYIKDAKQFVLKWKTYTSLIMQQFYLKSVSTIELFQTLQLFFDDLVLYRVEERIALVNANANNRPSSGGAPIVQ